MIKRVRELKNNIENIGSQKQLLKVSADYTEFIKDNLSFVTTFKAYFDSIEQILIDKENLYL